MSMPHTHSLTLRPFTAVAWQRGQVSNPSGEQWPVMSQLLLTSRSERERETERGEERRKFKLGKEKKGEGCEKSVGRFEGKEAEQVRNGPR